MSQHVTGIGITLVCLIVELFYIFRMLLPAADHAAERLLPFQPYCAFLMLSEIPVIGEALFFQTPLTYLALILRARWSGMACNRTPIGLAVRMAGENPVAVEAQGINVLAVRTGAVMVGSGLMAVGGAFLTMSAFDAFYFGMINGRGWICVALVIFASWQPGKALLGAILFAGLDAMQVRAQQLAGAVIPLSVLPDASLCPVYPSSPWLSWPGGQNTRRRCWCLSGAAKGSELNVS